MPQDLDLDVIAKEEGWRVPDAGYNLEKDREEARRRLAYGMLVLLAIVTLSIAGGTISGLLSIEEMKDLATAILAPLVVLVGTVFGFYYSGNQGHSGRNGP